MPGYLFKSIFCLLVLWGFYKLALEQQVAHQFKRFYLLGSVMLALALPLITLTYTVEAVPYVATQTAPTSPLPPTFQVMDAPPPPATASMNWLPILLSAVYGVGVLIFGLRFARNINHLCQKVRKNEQVRTAAYTAVLIPGKTVPHSFLQYVFLPKKAYEQDKVAPEILAHEQAHVSQKHTWDILLMEFLQVIFWFNPVLFLIKQNMALNHEFLADRAALNNTHNIKAYTNLLFTYSGGAHFTALSSPINYSLTRPPFRRSKKRIIMLSQCFSAKRLAKRLTFLLPILALCVYFFSQGIVAKPDYSDQRMTMTKVQNDWIPVYVEKDQSIMINGQKTDVQQLTQSLTRLTSYTPNERKERLKLILILDPRISWDLIGKISDTIQEYGAYSMIGHSIWEPQNGMSNYETNLEDYNRALELPVREQIQVYEFKTSFDLLGKGLSNEDLEESFKQSLQSLQANTKEKSLKINGQFKDSNLPQQSQKRVDIFELRKEKLFINGKPTEIEKIETELKQRYGKFSQEELANQIVIDVQSHHPEADKARVETIWAALREFGIHQYVWSASTFANRPENTPRNVISGKAPAGLPDVNVHPEDYVNRMQELNTTFFYNGEKITAERAKTILNENVNVQIASRFLSLFGENPIMQLAD